MAVTESKQIFNVLDFGATGNGFTDDGKSIRAAISAAEKQGGTVYFPPGTYRYTQTISIAKSNVTLAGDENATVLRYDNSRGAAISFQGGTDGISYVGLDGMTLVCGKGDECRRDGGSGIQVGPQVGEYTLKNIHIHNGWEGIHIDGGYGGIVDNITIDQTVNGGSIKGISLANSISNFFSRIAITARDEGWNIGSGVDTLGLDHCQIAGTNSAGLKYGIRFENLGSSHDPRWIRLNQCAVDLNERGSGYELKNGYGIELTDCQSNGGIQGILFTGASNIQVTGGALNNSWKNNIDVQQGTNLLLENISLLGGSRTASGSYDGIRIGGATDGIRIFGCQIGPDPIVGDSWVKNGINIAGGAKGYLLANNYVWDNAGKLINLEASPVSGIIGENFSVKPPTDYKGTSLLESFGGAITNSEDLTQVVVNVRDFGAKGDGCTDDSASIQAALAALGDSGGCLYFPAGTYRYKQTLCVEKNNITIAGDSKGQTLLYFDSQCGEAVRFDGNNRQLHHVGIKDLQVISFDAGTGMRTSGYGITCKNTDDYAIKNVRVLNGGTGVYLNHVVNSYLENVQINEYSDAAVGAGGSQNGIFLEDSVGVWLNHVEANCRDTGWQLEGNTRDIHFVNSGVQKTSSLAPSYGLRILAKEGAIPSDVSLTGCFMEVGDQGVGYSAEVGRDLLFSQCYNAFGKEAFQLGNVSNVQIVGGEFFGCREEGVSIYGGNSIQITGATISDCSLAEEGRYSGIWIGGTNQGASITNCRVGGNELLQGNIWQKYGVEIQTSLNTYLLSHNDLRDNLAGGIYSSIGLADFENLKTNPNAAFGLTGQTSNLIELGFLYGQMPAHVLITGADMNR